MVKGLRTQYWRKGNTFFGTMKSNRGKNVTLKFNAEDYDPIAGTIEVTEKRQFRRGDKHGTRTYTKTVKARMVDGAIVLGRTVKGSSQKIKEVVYRFSGDSRLESGFDTLMHGLRTNGGATPDEVKNLYDMWDSLTPKQKQEFYANYNASQIVLDYGSDTINEGKIDFADDRAYFELIRDLLTELVTRE